MHLRSDVLSRNLTERFEQDISIMPTKTGTGTPVKDGRYSKFKNLINSKLTV